MTNRAGNREVTLKRHLSDWPCRRIRTLEGCSAPSFAKASPSTQDAWQLLSLIIGLEAFLPLGIFPMAMRKPTPRLA